MEPPLPYKVIESEDGLTLKVSNHTPDINPNSLITIAPTERTLVESVDSDKISVRVTLLDKVSIICSLSGELQEASYEDRELTLELKSAVLVEVEKFLAVHPTSNSVIVEFGANILQSQKSISLKRFKILKQGVSGWVCEVVVATI